MRRRPLDPVEGGDLDDPHRSHYRWEHGLRRHAPGDPMDGGGSIVGVRGIVLALVVLALLGLGLARATAEDSVPPGACKVPGPYDIGGCYHSAARWVAFILAAPNGEKS